MNTSFQRLLLSERGLIPQEARPGYTYHTFEVPPGVAALRVRLRYHKAGICQLYLSVFGPAGYRGTRMKPGAVGAVELELIFGAGGASLGALPGPIEPGVWRVLLDLERTQHATEYDLSVEASPEPPFLPAPPPAPHNGRSGAAWYRGELHAHSHHSDGRTDVQSVVEAARRYGLDFLALTDHYTPAGWSELKALSGPDLCVIPGMELTAHNGHANLHGLSSWVNPFVDGEGWGVNDVARAVHAQGGLFCVNHAFSLDLGWRYHRFDWTLADLMEIYHHLEGSANTSQLTLWDSLLRQGLRITGVAGTDSHDPYAGRHRLGQVFTYVYAEGLNPQALLAGLKAGRAYVSLGPRLEFVATAPGQRAGMGERLKAPSSLTLEAHLQDLAFPARVLLIKNGFYHAHQDIPVPREALALQFQDHDPQAGDYYRLEVFALPPQGGTSGHGREWDRTLVLSNPIFLE
ncbi:CehA/McbA family metallohydrolase [Meiothermus granaticius]|uniref:CehA/McbA family metallohydrolase n=1 Tax=Meiothermus granaticius TaxID=863370 RepID=UPI0011BF35E2|nr:CehA/McbA family metallohydrolase [Meiothermus granaticius]